MKHPDIIVVGVGRTGTSTIARILHEDFGVHMANSWDTLLCNPLGNYEDLTMAQYSRYLTEKPEYTVEEWLKIYDFSFGGRGKQLVGLKCCQLAMATRDQWADINPKLVIRTYRPLSRTVDSMVRWREPKNEDYWVNFYRQREMRLRKHLDKEHSFPVLRIAFNEDLRTDEEEDLRTDEELQDILRPWVERFGYGII